MRAQIVSIGSELILGHLTDTNATFLAQELASLGVELRLVTQVGDDLPLLASVIDRASIEHELVVCTGGVGPTADDLTREAIARVIGEEPAVDAELLETVRAFFRARGVEMPERNQKQAWLIPSAEPLLNPIGTAPGWFVRRGGSVIVAMPGVPREMVRMWREQVVPRLESLRPARTVATTTLRTIGIGESAAEQLLSDLVALENPVVATYAKDDGVHVRVTGSATTRHEAERTRDQAVAEVRRRLDQHIYGIDNESLPRVLAGLLERHGLRLEVNDSGGGGRFAAMLASFPDSAQRLITSVMTPAPDGAGSRTSGKSAGTLTITIDVKNRAVADDVYEGSIAVSLRGAIAADETIPMRAAFEDFQRRSVLVAADVLRRALD